MASRVSHRWPVSHCRLQSAGAVIFLSIAGWLCLTGNAVAQGDSEHATARTITVSGTGTVSASPDEAIVRLGVQSRAREVKPALADASKRMASIIKSFHGNGILDADIRTVQYSVGFVPEPSPAGRSTNPGTNHTVKGYFQVTDVAEVTVRAISRLGDILDAALASGADEIQEVSFRISDSQELESNARSLAYAQARERAGQIAQLAGVTVGKVLSVDSVGGGPMGQTGFHQAALAAPQVSPGQLEVTVTLHVVYAING